MGKSRCGRRKILRLMAFGVTLGWTLGAVSARPAKRGRAPVRRMPLVVIDPGHGGVDPGAVSPRGVCEKDIVLSVAREFANQLAATRRYRVVLTRSTDEFIPLRERVARARAWDADVFLS